MQSDSNYKNNTPVPPTRHEIYYWKEGVIYLVRRVPGLKAIPCNEELLDMFKLPEPIKGGEGMEDSNPICLPSTSTVDFARLLTVIYPSITVEGYDSAFWSETEWTSVLQLAVMWEMAIIRAIAIQSLDKLASPALKINLGRRFDHDPWVIDGFFTLILRVEPLKEAEASELELKDIVGCALIREKVRAKLMELSSHVRVPTTTRYGTVLTRAGEYPDGMFLRTHAWVRVLIEDTFGIQTPS